VGGSGFTPSCPGTRQLTKNDGDHDHDHDFHDLQDQY